MALWLPLGWHAIVTYVFDSITCLPGKRKTPYAIKKKEKRVLRAWDGYDS